MEALRARLGVLLLILVPITTFAGVSFAEEENPFPDGTAEFYGLEKIDILSSDVTEQRPVVSDDGLEIFFVRAEPGPLYTVWRATRATREEEFGMPVLVPELSPPQTGATHAAFPYDLWGEDRILTVITYERHGAFGRMGDPGIKWRPDRETPFFPTEYSWFENIQDTVLYETATGLSPDGLEFFFSKGRGSTHVIYHIYRATRASLEVPFGPPELVEEFAYPGVDSQIPRVMPDSRVLLFRSELKLRSAVRSSVGEPFGPVTTYDVGIQCHYFDFTQDLKEFYFGDGHDLFRARLRQADDYDGDGILNVVEANPPGEGQSNLYLPDSDGDGLSDGVEDVDRNGAADEGETSTRSRDTDGDQYEDGLEVLYTGSDPLDDRVPGEPFRDEDGDALPGFLDPNEASGDVDGDRFLDGYEAAVLGLAAVGGSEDVPRLGDVDWNGVRDNADSQRVLGFFAGLSMRPFDAGRSDVNRDAYMDNSDAQVLMGYFGRVVLVLPAE